MKSNEKKMILIIVVIAVVIIGALLIIRNSKNGEKETEQGNTQTEKYVDVYSDGTKVNKSSKLQEAKKLDGLEISNIQLAHQNGSTVLLGDVKNTTSADIKSETFATLTLLDDEGNTIKTLDVIISPVKAGQTVQLNCGVSSDYANAYDFTIVKK